MISNYILIAWRNFIKHRTFSLINITGFALAMASCFLMVFHIQEELSYEKEFPKHESIYRVHSSGWAKSEPALAEPLTGYFPEIISTTRFYEYGRRVLSHNEFRVETENGFMADSTTIDMLDLYFVFGSPHKSLREPFTIILTQSFAQKFFGNEDPVDKVIKMNNAREYTVTGVIRDFPENTHFKIDYLVSFSTFYKTIPENWTSARGWMGVYTYALLHPDDLPKVNDKLTGFRLKFYESVGTEEEIRKNWLIEFQPIKDIHLHSHLESEMSKNSNAGYVYILGAVALFILLVASVNFINLNLSLAFRRMKETGLRKVMGAYRIQLVRQYLTETLLLCVMAFVLALALFLAVIPYYNELTGKSISPGEILTVDTFGMMVAIIFIAGIISGFYPAIFMSRFTPIQSMKGQKDPGTAASNIRKGLVIFQFAVSVFMIASTIIIYRQMNFFQSAELGFNKEQLIAVTLYGDLAKKFGSDQEVIKAPLKNNPAILEVGATSTLPGDMIGFSTESIIPAGVAPDAQLPSVRMIWTDYGLIPALQLTIVEGRNFSPHFNDSASYILNETAVKALSLSEPIGSSILHRGVPGTIVGVVKDFHFTSLHSAIEPLAFWYHPDWTAYLLIKVKPENTSETLSYIESTLKKIDPANLFSYSFYDEKWNTQYREENKMSVLFNAFSFFMMAISCIGLFGLSAIAIEARQKEIGIRKVVGASVQKIIQLLSKEFIFLVLIGGAIALPLAWYAMHAWLEKFAFKISITADVFVITLALALLVAFACVLFNALKSALANPINALRSE